MKQQSEGLSAVGPGLDVPLNRDLFLRKLLRELAEVLEEVVGVEEASGFVSIVGRNIAEWLNADYRLALGVSELSRAQLADVLVDLKRRIDGDFRVISQDDDKLVLSNASCPFGNDLVKGQDALCMMTCNVFGTIAAENLGFAKVGLHETIAKGSDACRVVVHLTHNKESDAEQGYEYYKV